MTTASTYTSVRGRLCTLALAGSLALGVLASGGTAALASGADGAPGAATASAGFDVTVDSVEELSDLTAIVAGGGDGVNLRAEPAHDAEVLAAVPDGTEVALRIDMVDTVYDPDGVTRWWPVAVDGQDGWMSGAYLVAPGAADTAPAEAASEPAPSPGSGYEYSGAMVAAISADGDGVNLRAVPDPQGSIVAALPDGTVVNLRIDVLDTVYDAAGTRWWPVEVDGMEGWVSGFYLVDTTEPAPTEAPEETPAATEEAQTPAPAFAAGDFAEVRTASREGATLRASGDPEAAETGAVPEQGLVEILDGPVSFANSEAGWYEVRWDELTGFIDGDLLVPAEAPQPARTPTPAAPTPAPTAEAAAASTGGFIVPLDSYRFSQDYGCSALGFYPIDPAWGCGLHDGVDLAAPSGTPIKAAADGTVLAAGWCDCGLGYYVEIDHGDGLTTIYGHMASQPFVAAGQRVARGEVIGPVGSTGLSTGPHVHFMVRKDGVTQDPKAYLPSL